MLQGRRKCGWRQVDPAIRAQQELTRRLPNVTATLPAS
jgi:hypothetical protein